MALAADVDAEEVAHRRGKSIAADQIVGAHGLGLAIALIDEGSGNAGRILLKTCEHDLVTDRDRRERPRAVLQDRIEPGLRAHEAALGTEGRVAAFVERRHPDAPDLV